MQISASPWRDLRRRPDRRRPLHPPGLRDVVAIVDGDLTQIRLARSTGGWMLQAENPAFRSVPLEGETEMVI